MTSRKPLGQDGVDPIMAEATRWFVALHDDPFDKDERPAFEAWRDADPRHEAAYIRLQYLWGASGHLPSLIRVSPVVDRRAVLRRFAGAGAAAVLVAGAGKLFLDSHPFATHRTRAGERSTVILVDGSRIELSTATTVATDLSAGLRRIRLLEGEAWFEVEPDRRRPFVVEASGGSITALGTSFAVAVARDGAEVSVTEHAVQVQAYGRKVRVSEGERVRYGPRGAGDVQAADLTGLAWREGRLAFVNRPLGEVAVALDRWTGDRTVILDAGLAARPVTLTIGTEDAGEGLQRLAGVTPMRVTRLMPGLTAVRKI